MRHFGRVGTLDRLTLEARIVYTVFCGFLLLGYATGGWLYLDDDLGVRGSAATRYYLGESESDGKAEPRTPPEARTEGPDLDLPPETPAFTADDLRIAKPPRQVIETFHFHLFSVPICLLIISHLFMLSTLSSRIKRVAIVGTSAATLLHLVVPPLVRFASPQFGSLMFPSAVLMGIGWTYLTVWPVIEMWRPTKP